MDTLERQGSDEEIREYVFELTQNMIDEVCKRMSDVEEQASILHQKNESVKLNMENNVTESYIMLSNENSIQAEERNNLVQQTES